MKPLLSTLRFCVVDGFLVACWIVFLLGSRSEAQQQTLILDNGFAIGPGALSVKPGARAC